MLLNAIYTMSYMDALDVKPTLLDNIVWDSEEHTIKLKNMIYNKFYNWEISGETIQEFQLFMETKFNQYKDYYLELLTAYETEIDFLDGNKQTHTRVITDEGSTTFTPRSEYERAEYDLPRSNSSENRPSSKNTSKGVAGEDTTDVSNERSETESSTGGNVIDLKKKYMDIIRSIYSEFADKFKPCFIDLFS